MMATRSIVLALFCVAAAASLCAALPANIGACSVELSPSVNLIGKYDWELLQTDNGEWSRCLDMVW
jgi:hypothetical protein